MLVFDHIHIHNCTAVQFIRYFGIYYVKFCFMISLPINFIGWCKKINTIVTVFLIATILSKLF